MDTISMTPKTHRRRLLGAGTLVLLTALAGAVARGKSLTSQITPPPAGAAQFTAPGSGPVSFTGHLDRSAVQVGGDGLVRMELVLAAARGDNGAVRRVPTDLLVVLDRSGSMDGDKLVHARAAIRELVSQLEPLDRFALVTYSDGAELRIPLATAIPEARQRWLSTVSEINADGGTNMSAGLDLALATVAHLRAAGRAPRVILISDGLANQGDASHEGLVGRAQRATRAELPLTTVGVGADFNEALMTALADAGGGNYYYVERSTELAPVFAREFGAARATVASAVAVEITPADGVRVLDAAGYPLEESGGRIVLRPGTLFGGQERRVWVTLSVPHDRPADHALGRFALSYKEGDTARTLTFGETPKVACVASADDFFAAVDLPAWERSVTVEGFNKMQDEVAREVKAGRREEAGTLMRAFRRDTEAMNARLRSPEVQKKLDALGQLESQVADAFEGADQKAKQNALSKGSAAAAYDSRRPGSKY
jgi:Ca-activated chloride channel family protein